MRGQHADLDPDRADLVELAAVEPLAVLEDLVAQHLLLELLEDRLGVDAPLDLALGERRDRGPRAPGRRGRSSRACPGCAWPRTAGTSTFFLDLAVEVGADLPSATLQLRLACRPRAQVVDDVDDLLDRVVRRSRARRPSRLRTLPWRRPRPSRWRRRCRRRSGRGGCLRCFVGRVDRRTRRRRGRRARRRSSCANGISESASARRRRSPRARRSRSRCRPRGPAR